MPLIMPSFSMVYVSYETRLKYLVVKFPTFWSILVRELRSLFGIKMSLEIFLDPLGPQKFLKILL